MKDTFNPGRFMRLLKKTLFERPVQMIGLITLILAFVLLSYAILKTITGFEEAQTVSLIFGFVGGGSFLASFIFAHFSSGANGSSFLTLPASHFEKWLCAIIITGILFPLIFLIFYRVVDSSFVASYHNSLDGKSPFYKEMFDAVSPLALNGFIAQKTYMMFANFTAAMLVGSLYFNKVSFIKVALIMCGLFIGGHFFNEMMARAIFTNLDKALPYYCVFITVGKEYGKVLLPDYASKAVEICILYIMPAILCGTAYIRLREKEF